MNTEVLICPVCGAALGEASGALRCERGHSFDLAREAGLRYRTIGEGKRVTAQLPAAHWRLARGTETILYLGAEISKEKESVPNLIGMRYNEARDLLSRYGLYLHSLNAVFDAESQCVGTQSVKAGSAAAHGSVIEVSLLASDTELLGKY